LWATITSDADFLRRGQRKRRVMDEHSRLEEKTKTFGVGPGNRPGGDVSSQGKGVCNKTWGRGKKKGGGGRELNWGRGGRVSTFRGGQEEGSIAGCNGGGWEGGGGNGFLTRGGFPFLGGGSHTRNWGGEKSKEVSYMHVTLLPREGRGGS